LTDWIILLIELWLHAARMATRKSSSGVGARIRSTRNSLGITQARLAEEANITAESMSRIERGRMEPSSKLVLRLAGALGVSPSDLFSKETLTPARPALRPVEYRLLQEVKSLSDEQIDDVIKAVRLLVGVGRTTNS
jgi:transcriptional regulator with XRE-family HTH domain